MADLVIIASVADESVIGYDNDIPWMQHNGLADSSDIVRFRKEYWERFNNLTQDYRLLMGKNAYFALKEFIPEHRKIVLSQTLFIEDKNVDIVPSFEEALRKYSPEPLLYVVGGQSLFEKSITKAERLEIACLHAFYEGDRHFPNIEEAFWKLIHAESRRLHTNYTYERYQ